MVEINDVDNSKQNFNEVGYVRADYSTGIKEKEIFEDAENTFKTIDDKYTNINDIPSEADIDDDITKLAPYLTDATNANFNDPVGHYKHDVQDAVGEENAKKTLYCLNLKKYDDSTNE